MKNWLTAALTAALALVLAGSALGASGPSVVANVNVDFDHGASFPQNKQNEPSVARDPLTGALIAGANDESSLDLCAGTTAPLASPCPFTPGRPISAYYRSSDGQSWTGGYLPGFDTIGRLSGGDPEPRRGAASLRRQVQLVMRVGGLLRESRGSVRGVRCRAGHDLALVRRRRVVVEPRGGGLDRPHLRLRRPRVDRGRQGRVQPVVRPPLPLLGRLLQQLRRQRARKALCRVVRRRGAHVVGGRAGRRRQQQLRAGLP